MSDVMGQLARVMSASLLLGLVACSSTSGTLEAEKNSRISKLDPSFRLYARVGELPLNLEEVKNEQIVRYAVKVPGRPSEYLILVFPEATDGTLKLPVQQDKEIFEVNTKYRRYLDRLLRAHRQILKGQLDDASQMLKEIDREFDVSYGSLVLMGNIALLKGRDDLAAKFFKFAVRLFPGGNILPEAALSADTNNQ